MEDLQELQQILDIQFNDPNLLLQAVTHASYLNENQGETESDNERLEFLGDAVLDFVVGAYLYHHYPNMTEGEMTPVRAAIVRTQSLAQFARKIKLGRYLRLGYGEEENGGRNRNPILCGAFEAVMGAMYLDSGLDAVMQRMDPLIAPALETVLAKGLHKDAKSEFQVWAQGALNITPHYETVAESGPDHAKEFTVVVKINDEAWGAGVGSSKQAAAQLAAEEALVRIQED